MKLKITFVFEKKWFHYGYFLTKSGPEMDKSDSKNSIWPELIFGIWRSGYCTTVKFNIQVINVKMNRFHGAEELTVWLKDHFVDDRNHKWDRTIIQVRNFKFEISSSKF